MVFMSEQWKRMKLLLPIWIRAMTNRKPSFQVSEKSKPGLYPSIHILGLVPTDARQKWAVGVTLLSPLSLQERRVRQSITLSRANCPAQGLGQPQAQDIFISKAPGVWIGHSLHFSFKIWHLSFYGKINEQHQGESRFKKIMMDFSDGPVIKKKKKICLPMQGTQVWSLVWEDSTYPRAPKTLCCNYWSQPPGACALQQEKHPREVHKPHQK